MADRIGSYMKASVLLWADEISTNSLWNIMAYMFIVWKVNFTYAAAIMSVMTGFIKILQLPMSFLVDTFLGHHGMLSISTVSLSIGWSLLGISTSSFLLKMPLSSCENSPFCVGDLQWSLFHFSLSLITVGIVGNTLSLKDFRIEQLTTTSQEQIESEARQIVPTVFISILVNLFCMFVLPLAWPWGARLAIPAICVVGATFLFFRGSGGYTLFDRPRGPFVRVFKVVLASCLKAGDPLLRDPRELYEKYENGIVGLLPHTNRLRFLDKAAILSGNQTIAEQEWRLCSVTEVEETKIFFLMIPMWMSFIVCGLFLSIGNTYFLLQAFNMNPIFMFTTIAFLLFLRDISKYIFVFILQFLLSLVHILGGLKQKYIPPVAIAVGMLVSILCCIVAALVESMRLNQGSLQMSVFWLIPQFLLLGSMNGAMDRYIMPFTVTHTPDSMKFATLLVARGAIGVGYIASVLFVYVTGRVSAEKWGQSWFGETINESRLDNLYWALAALISINLVFYVRVACRFDYKELNSTSEQQQQQQ